MRLMRVWVVSVTGVMTSLVLAHALLAQPPKRDAKSSDQGPSPAKVGLLQNDPKAFDGYTLLAPSFSTTTYLIDMEGRVVILGLESVRDFNGQPVIRRVHRADKAYPGGATALAPDLVVGYCQGYRASWATCLGDLTDEVLLENDSAWSADHCADVSEVPGVLFSNRSIRAEKPSLVDLAPSILTEFGLPIPSAMEGRNIFST